MSHSFVLSKRWARAARAAQALVFCSLLVPVAGLAGEVFDYAATLRVDLHHAGDARRERYVLDELRVEGPWPGSRTRLIDEAGRGCAAAEVYAAGRDGQLLFRRNHCSLFGEWQTTDEARQRERIFSETVRLPLPRQAVRLVLRTRDRRGQQRLIFETAIDPRSVAVSRERRRGGLRVLPLHRGGPPRRSLDLVILGDGYQDWELPKYRQDAQRLAALLLATPPFAALRRRINVWGVESPSRESGVDEPLKGVFRDTALSMSFGALGSSRYLMTTDGKAVHDVAANAPYDAILIVSNTSRYGGGGIYNLYASSPSDNDYDAYIAVHEFGHSFAGLGDEYYTSKVAYNEMYPRGVEPWEPNITAERRRARLKWADLVAAETPVPTPAADRRQAGRVGLFEGAGYSAKGLFRPARDCKMFDKGERPFCPVCHRAVQRAIERIIDDPRASGGDR